MSLKVLGAGLGRTGTLSLKLALEELLGAPCYHMSEPALRHPEHFATWAAAARGEPVDWDALFEGYAAAVDWPQVTFWRELADHYPEARIILTVRDPERWYASARDTIWRATVVTRRWPVRWLVTLAGRGASREAVERAVWGPLCGGDFEDEARVLAAVQAHEDAVRAAFPPERLLVFRIHEGWGPLCDFLGTPVPDRPFPKVNDKDEVRRALVAMQALAWAMVLTPPLLVAALLLLR